MSINWNWKDNIGVLKVKDIFYTDGKEEFKEFYIQIYEGNADLIFIYEYEEDNQERYSLYNIFCDLPHLKRCIEAGMTFDEWQHITFFKWTRKIEQFANVFYKLDIGISFEHSERSVNNE